MHRPDILTRHSVLVLNRHWQAIGTHTVARAIEGIMSTTMKSLDIGDDGALRVIESWKEWMALEVRVGEEAVRTVRGPVRVPTVVVCRYGKVPRRCRTFSSRAVWERDNHRCQYTGRVLAPGEGNVDHVVPRSRGGGTNWENCVLACREINSRKADRTPEEAGLRLLARPTRPPALPVTLTIRRRADRPHWNLFLPEAKA